MKFRKVMAVILAAALTFSLAACGGDKGTTNTETPSTSGSQQTTSGDNGTTVKPNNNTGGTNSEIIIGTWWKQYYDSSATGVDSDPSYAANLDAPDDNEEKLATKAFNREIAQYKFDNVKTIEQKYGVTFYWENLTFEGVTDSINTLGAT